MKIFEEERCKATLQMDVDPAGLAGPTDPGVSQSTSSVTPDLAEPRKTGSGLVAQPDLRS
ncbi:unnamed protein product [Arabis nemorensis]|uniref:Uncharacterized protein n=1 Tax=Arabis nemorensis TaxID=586526 RepID=A0A565C2I0_9BRAS|nr:unnamed protein product [Arabis nemorensis]